jgi:hypothetical protein
MTKTGDNPATSGGQDHDHGLADKMQEYHRRGGPHGAGDAKRVEGDIAATAIVTNDDLKKGRPPSDPERRD